MRQSLVAQAWATTSLTVGTAGHTLTDSDRGMRRRGESCHRPRAGVLGAGQGCASTSSWPMESQASRVATGQPQNRAQDSSLTLRCWQKQKTLHLLRKQTWGLSLTVASLWGTSMPSRLQGLPRSRHAGSCPHPPSQGRPGLGRRQGSARGAQREPAPPPGRPGHLHLECGPCPLAHSVTGPPLGSPLHDAAPCGSPGLFRTRGTAPPSQTP